MSTSTLPAPTRPTSSSSVNVGEVERILSVVGGGALALTGLSTRDALTKILLPIAGGMLVYRGMSGHCSLYSTLGISTAEPTGERTAVAAGHGVKLQEAITIRKPAHEIYAMWRKFDQLPRFMSHLREVEILDQQRSRWTAKAPLGMSVSWEAEIVNDKPNELIAWRSLPGATVDTAGSVHFKKAPGDRGTEVHVTLKYDPPGGKVGSWLAWLAGQSPEIQIKEDLRRLKELLEAGEVPTIEGQPSGRA